MFVPTNPEAERIRAQAVLRSFTEQREAARLFARKRQDDRSCDEGEPAAPTANADRRNGRLVERVVTALTRSSRPAAAEPVQQAVYSPQQATTTGCS